MKPIIVKDTMNGAEKETTLDEAFVTALQMAESHASDTEKQEYSLYLYLQEHPTFSQHIKDEYKKQIIESWDYEIVTYKTKVTNMTKEDDLSDFEMQLWLEKLGWNLYDETKDNEIDTEQLYNLAMRYGFYWNEVTETWKKPNELVLFQENLKNWLSENHKNDENTAVWNEVNKWVDAKFSASQVLKRLSNTPHALRYHLSFVYSLANHSY